MCCTGSNSHCSRWGEEEEEEAQAQGPEIWDVGDCGSFTVMAVFYCTAHTS